MIYHWNTNDMFPIEISFQIVPWIKPAVNWCVHTTRFQPGPVPTVNFFSVLSRFMAMPVNPVLKVRRVNMSFAIIIRDNT